MMLKNKQYVKLKICYFQWKKINFIIFSLFFALNSAEALITKTLSINLNPVKNLEKIVDENTLVLIALDDVIFTPESQMFSRYSLYRFFIKNIIYKAKFNSKYQDFIESWLKTRKLKLVEPNWVEFINRLKASGATVYGFYSMPLKIENIEKNILKELEVFHIGFDQKINNSDELEIMPGSVPASFYHGVLFTGEFDIASVLYNMIKVTNISPYKIIVLSNSLDELEKIDDILGVFNMDFYNIQYLGIDELSYNIDYDLVNFQKQYLLNYGIWLEDEKAKKLLTQSKTNLINIVK